ncbi:MAG: MFS transporter [Micromonosporaceae bacterium]
MTARRSYPLLWAGQFTATAGLTVVVPLLPFYLAGFGLRGADLALWTGLALTAPAVTQVVSTGFWGWVGDRHGRAAMVLRAQIGLAIAVGLMALADSPWEFLAARLIQGAFGGVGAASAAFACSLAQTRNRGRSLGGLVGATGAGSLVGPLIGSLLAASFGYPMLFTVVAALLAGVSVASLLLLREPPASRAARREPPETGFGGAARRLWANPSSRNLILAGFAAQAAVYAVLVVFALRVQEVTSSTGEATVWVGVLQAATWAAALVGSAWWGWRNDRKLAHRNFALAAAGCALAVAAQGFPMDPALLLPSRVVQGFCFVALAQSVLYVVAGLLPEHVRGAGMGAATGLIESGQVVGPLLGSLTAALLPLPVAFAAIATLLGVAAVLAAVGGRPQTQQPPTPATPLVAALVKPPASTPTAEPVATPALAAPRATAPAGPLPELLSRRLAWSPIARPKAGARR